MITLKIQKNKNNFNIFIVSVEKKTSKVPHKVGLNKLDKHSIVGYNLIILLQKYGAHLSKGLRKIILTKLLKIS